MLLSDDALTRYKAVEALESLHTTDLVPLLEARLAEVDGAAATEQDPRVQKRTARSIVALKDWERSMTIVQTIFSGISLGSILVLIGLGLAIIYGLMGVINMAHGEFLMVVWLTLHAVVKGHDLLVKPHQGHIQLLLRHHPQKLCNRC